MNTFDSSVRAGQRVGLIELPDLAETLTRAGVEVITGDSFRAAVPAIKDAMAQGGAFPIIVADVPVPGLRAWVGKIQSSAPGVTIAVVRNPDAPVITGATEISVPATVNGILAAVALPGLPGAGGQLPYPAASQPAPAAAGLDLPDFDDLIADDTPAPAARMVPGGRRAARAAQADTGFDEDPFAAAPVPAPAAAAVQSPVPAPVVDEWDTHTFTQPAAPAPAPQALIPAPVAASAPVDDFSWDTPVAAAPVAQVQAAPVAPVVATAPEPEFSWAAPVAPEPVAAPAPVAVAAPPAPAFDWGTGTEDASQGVTWTPRGVAPASGSAPAVEDFDFDDPDLLMVPASAPAPQAPVQQATPAPAFQPAPVAPVAAPVSAPVPVQSVPVQAVPVQMAPVQPLPVQPALAVPVQQYQPMQQAATGMFDRFEASRLAGTGRSAAGLGSLAIVFAGKGGVGKSSIAIQLAKTAADAGLKVVLIDGNSGQGDQRTYLRLNGADLPSIYDAAAFADPKTAIITPDALNAKREETMGRLGFALVTAPPEDINDPALISSDLYGAVIEHARRTADLVILDTQIVESAERPGAVNELIIPSLLQDAWGIGVSDMTNPGVNNLNQRLGRFHREGVAKDRLMVVLNRVNTDQMDIAANAAPYFQQWATYLGAVEADPAIAQHMNAGRVNVDSEPLQAVVAQTLHRITGNTEFSRLAAPEDTGQASASRRGMFGFLKRRAA